MSFYLPSKWLEKKKKGESPEERVPMPGGVGPGMIPERPEPGSPWKPMPWQPKPPSGRRRPPEPRKVPGGTWIFVPDGEINRPAGPVPLDELPSDPNAKSVPLDELPVDPNNQWRPLSRGRRELY